IVSSLRPPRGSLRRRACDSRYLPPFPTRRSSDLQRTVASDHHERVDTMLHQLVMRLLTSFRGFELHATGRFQNRTATLYDIADIDRKSTRLNSSHVSISYAVFCLTKKTYMRLT